MAITTTKTLNTPNAPKTKAKTDNRSKKPKNFMSIKRCQEGVI